MSTSQNRRERRHRDRLLKLPPHKMLAVINKRLPKDMKVKLSNQEQEMSYQEWLNSVQLTPEMIEELKLHDENERKEGAMSIGVKNLDGFDFEVINDKK
jgi:hypothetical protein